MKRPPALTESDRIAVVAPSGPFDDALLRRGLARLAPFEVTAATSMWGRRDGFFAGSDDARLPELQCALDDPELKAILIARGGYGLARLLPRLDFSAFLDRPKWLIGFSDATALHLALNQQGIASIHGGNGTTLSSANEAEIDELHRLLRGVESQVFAGLRPLVPGNAVGPIFGGNLTVLFAEAASGRLKIPAGSILLLEDVNETSYRIDRMLTALLDGGHLSHVSGILLGDFVDCSSGKFEVPVSDVLLSRLACLKVPISSDFPAGHGTRNRPLVLGSRARLSGESVVLQLER